MENEYLIPETPQDDLFEREERCIKSIKNLSRAALMRILTAMILMIAMVVTDLDLWVYCMLTLVF